MRFYRTLCLICIVIISNSIFAQSQKELRQLMRDRGEYYFTLSVDDPAQIQDLSSLCSVDGSDGRNVVAYANQQEYDKLLAAGFQPNLETPPSLRANVTMWDGHGTYNWDSYLTYSQYVTMMEGFPSKAIEGRTCTLIDLGTLSTSNHRRLLGVRINNGELEGKPKFLYTSTMHGDEITGMILMLRLIDELCTSNDSRILDLLNDLDIYIFPLTNPDGTYNGGNNTVNNAKRYNGNSVDLNRNYRDYFNGDHPDNKNYQEETLWTMALADENLFTMGANYHGGSEVMNYCWDWVFENHADVDWWEYVCTEYVQLSRQFNSSYMGGYYQTSSNYDYDGVTRGATWYSITGSRQDYMNAYAECREVTVECSTTKTPNASQLPDFWSYNHNSMLTLMEQARNGVHGVVYDAQTGQTIQGVTVSVLNHDIHNSHVTTHSVGDFHRPIKGGTYTFIFDKEGYARKFVEVTVADGQRVDLTVNLNPSSTTQVECFTQFIPNSSGAYLMGCLNGSTLIMPTHNNANTNTSVSVTATSYSVNPTEDGFTLDRGTEPLRIGLDASGTAGQYFITYKGRLLTRSNNSLIWAKPSNSSGYGVNLSSYRWYVNANGIYQQQSNSKYYLYYDTNSNNFKTSTTNNSNITFYMECNCSVVQSVNLVQGWNWWSAQVVADDLLAQIEQGLGANGVKIVAKDGSYRTYSTNLGGWFGTLTGITVGQMYKIQTNTSCDISLTGTPVNPSECPIILKPGFTWIGYTPSVSLSVSEAMSGYTPTAGDVIKSKSGSYASYSGNLGRWVGSLTLEPGKGYIYESKATETKTFYYPSGN